jgi:predicted metal-dependent phosphoesterase TrpH
LNYLYETHLHTVQASTCAISPGRDYIRRYKALGYTGIIITDHFYNGNSSISRHLPWRQWVDRFCRGYEEARNEGARHGLDVFFGWEETFDDDDYLIYGLDKAWLLEHPEAAHWTRREQYETVRQYGGCVVQAHPFRQHYYIRGIHLSTGCVDAVEVANAGNRSQSYDALALWYAERLGLPATAGSDIHSADDVRQGETFGVYLDKKMKTIQDYVKAIQEHTIQGLRISPGRCDFQGNETVSLPVDIRDAEDRSTDQDLWEFLEGKGPFAPKGAR